MPLTAPDIFWLHEPPVAGFLKARGRAAGRVLGRRDRPADTISLSDLDTLRHVAGSRLVIELDAGEAFFQSFNGRISSPSDLGSIVRHTAARLVPVREEALVLLARPSRRQPARADILQLRAATLDVISSKADALGLRSVWLCAEAAPAELFALPASRLISHREHLATVFAGVALTLALLGLLAGLDQATLRAAEAAAAETAQLRARVLERTQAEQAISALGEAAQLGLDRQSADQRLSLIARAARALPDDSHLTALSIEGQRLVLSGRAGDTGRTLTAVSEAFPDAESSLVRAVASEGAGLQEYSIRIEEPAR